MQKQPAAFYGLGPLVALLALVVTLAATAPAVTASTPMSAQAPAGRTEGPFTEVSAGDSHTCGVKADGTIGCWGRNDRGQAPASPGGRALRPRRGGPRPHLRAQAGRQRRVLGQQRPGPGAAEPRGRRRAVRPAPWRQPTERRLDLHLRGAQRPERHRLLGRQRPRAGAGRSDDWPRQPGQRGAP